ncbi:hypothetical protein AMS68_001672 [Peltaster fructicola]|uniref:C2H2-type domain-containing protein n=1 Tax=Peltaster fructicola TaxID=286661 RepID=A0A6H0XNE1_9PEZI|nr:hypothetical protein AMS68_001672 [Peltaster fructicola]
MKRGRISSLASDTAALSIHNSSESAAKYAAYERSTQPNPIIWCSLPPHEPQSFSSTTLYETHYHSEHSYRCSECHKNFPSAYFLDLHITELHDPICAARKDAGLKTYACFVEGCDKVCMDWKRRRSHLVDKHGFPRNYDFFVVIDGIDGRKSLLRPGIDEQGHRRSSRERHVPDAVEQEDIPSYPSSSHAVNSRRTTKEARMWRTDDDIGIKTLEQRQEEDQAVDGIASSLGSLHMVPRNVKFGQRKGQAGLMSS